MALPGYPTNPGGSQTMGGSTPIPGAAKHPGYPKNPGGSQSMGGGTGWQGPSGWANFGAKDTGKGLDEVPPSTPAARTAKPVAPSNPLADFANSPLGLALKLGMSGANPNASNAYLSQFQNSLASARGDIAHQLAGALQDINQNKAYAQAALNQLPAGINAAYGQAQGNINHVMRGADAAVRGEGLAQAGVPANMGGGSLADYMAPEQAALATEKGGDLANIPLLGVGIQQAAAQAAAASNNNALGEYGNLDQMGAQLANQNGLALAQIEANRQAQNQGYLQSIGLAGINNAAQLANIRAGQQSPLTGAAGGIYSNTGLSMADVNSAIHSPDWANNVTAIQNGTFTQRDLSRLQAHYPVLYQALAANYGNLPAFKSPPK